jgi:hypothetical protein
MDNKVTTLGGTASDVTVGKIAVRLQFSLSLPSRNANPLLAWSDEDDMDGRSNTGRSGL